ncbi:MAG: glycoside hydrolase [Ruminococcaceae bacterium]|nr:glycoside hydrolase [Oscillospiraceae bacterium]
MTHENKFGMFIHWGLYGATGVQDQVFARMDWPREKYEALMHAFNPVKYDPEKWVLLAKEAGMEYICFTTKHHDGFCMWDTAYTDYKITNTPYGKDVLKMLADACAKHGMKLSFYYSCPDWHHENGYNPASTHQWKAHTENGIDHAPYLEYVRGQVRELCTNYGPLYTFFWDIPPRIKDPSFNEMIRELQPGIYINDRGYDVGDFSTPEREYKSAEGDRFTRMTEACNSLGEQSWGYRSNEDFYSMRHLTSAIDRMMAMGASYLLNVGPNGEGEITEDYASRLRRIGDWYKRMEGALVCHEADDFNYKIKANKAIVTKKNGKSYFHFPDGIRSSSVALQYFPNMPKSVRLLNTGKPLNASFDLLPEYFSNGQAQPFLHITGIPVDDLANEAIVIEIEW